MRKNPANIRYESLAKVCEHYFGPPRTSGGSHAVYNQVRQVLAAIDKKEATQ